MPVRLKPTIPIKGQSTAVFKFIKLPKMPVDIDALSWQKNVTKAGLGLGMCSTRLVMDENISYFYQSS